MLVVKVTATMLANDSKSILDEVIYKGQEVVVQRHGKPVAEIRKTIGVRPQELIRRMKNVRFTEAEAAEMEAALKKGAKVFGDGGGNCHQCFDHDKAAAAGL